MRIGRKGHIFWLFLDYIAVSGFGETEKWTPLQCHCFDLSP